MRWLAPLMESFICSALDIRTKQTRGYGKCKLANKSNQHTQQHTLELSDQPQPSSCWHTLSCHCACRLIRQAHWVCVSLCVCVLVCVLVCRLNRRFIALSPSQDLRVDDEVGAFPLFVRPQFGGRGGGIFFPLHRVRRSSCAAARGTPGGRPINAASLFMRPFVRYRLNVSVMCKCAEFNDLALISFEINFKLFVLKQS